MLAPVLLEGLLGLPVERRVALAGVSHRYRLPFLLLLSEKTNRMAAATTNQANIELPDAGGPASSVVVTPHIPHPPIELVVDAVDVVVVVLAVVVVVLTFEKSRSFTPVELNVTVTL